MTPSQRTRRTTLAALTAAATCTTLGLVPSTASAVPTGTTVTSGTIGGANWKAEVPASWNGTVLLWNHGIRLPTSTDRSAEVAPTGTDGSAEDALLAQGYALLGSSYRSQGFAVRDAVNDDLALLAAFKTSHPGVTRTFVWGASLGGLITETLAEERPALFAGAAPGCGVIAGAVPIADQTLDTALMVKAILLPSLKVGGYATDAEADAAATAVRAGITNLLSNATTKTGAAGRVLAIATLQGLPFKTESYNGASLGSFVGAAAQGVITQASAAILNSRDGIKKSGGNVATNVGTSYLAKATPEAIARFQALGLPGSLLRSYARTIDRRVTRVAASAKARATARLNGAPTGAVSLPVVTMHTEYDPFVTASNEALFATRVAAKGTGARVLQLFVAPPAYADKTASGGGAPYGAGHCVFTKEQWLAQLATLEAFVAGGKPSPTAVASIWSTAGAAGLDSAFVPLPWTSTKQ